MLDKPTAGGGICARRRVYLTDRPEDMCRAGMAIQNANDTFQCTFRDEGRIARIFQVRGEFIGLWIGQANGWSDYTVSFAEDDRGTVIALSWVETRRIRRFRKDSWTPSCAQSWTPGRYSVNQ